MHCKVAYTSIAFVLFLGAIVTDAFNMCTFRPPREDIDWNRVRSYLLRYMRSFTIDYKTWYMILRSVKDRGIGPRTPIMIGWNP